MYAFFTSLWLLPLAEIIGFVVIGGEIGLLYTLLWLSASGFAGFYLLGKSGAPPAPDQDIFMAEEMFDRLSLVIAALLLIFPGFISDALSLPFLIAPARHWIFGHAGKNPDSPIRRFVKNGESFSCWYYSETRNGSSARKTIEGNFKRTDHQDTLPGSK